MTPETLTEQLKSDLGEDLRSVILYGSAAAGDHVGKHSDYNILVVTTKLDTNLLTAMSGTTGRWVRKGNPPPLMFTRDRLSKSADVFPIELLDMKGTHRVLHGEDVLKDITVSRDNLRLELEHELKGKLIKLREQFLLTKGKSRAVVDLMIDSLSTFLVLFRAALRLYQAEVPQHKLEALQALGKHITFDADVFETIYRLKAEGGKGKDGDTEALFERYLVAVEAVTDAVDAYIRQEQ
jgi:hypothetical protein